MAALFLQNTNPASALELTNLEPQYSDDSQIELLTPEDGYDFDANFLGNNQTLTYTATVHNDDDKAIKITDIDFTVSSYDFLSYSYDGIKIGDTIDANQSTNITLTVRTNDQATQTVAEDLKLSLNYQLVEDKPTPSPTPDDPNQSDTTDETSNPESTENPATSDSAIIMAIVALISIIAIVVLVRKTNRRTLAIVLAIPFAALLYSNSARAEGDLTFSILGKVRFTNVYTVSIDPNGGEYDGETEVKVREGDIFTPANVARDTYNFVSWEVNPGELDDNNQIEIHANTTLKALWNEIYYTLTIKPNGGEYNGSTEDYQQSYRPHEYANVLTPTLTGHTFSHYSIEDGGTFAGGQYQMESDTTLTAQYDIDSYAVTINPNGGSYNDHTTSYTENYDYNTEITMSQATRTHYRFTGWQMSAGSLDESNKFKVTQTVTLTAQWEPINFTLTIDPNGGSYSNHDAEFSEDYLEGTEITLSTPTKEHYHFDYWILEDNSHSTATSVTMNEDIKLIAHYSIDQLHVTIDPNGGSYKNSTSVYEADLDYGTELTLRDDISRENYVLSGWTKDNVASALDRDTETITVVADTNLVAEWHETRIVTVNPNGGIYNNSDEPSEYRVEINTTFTLDEATKEDYVFDYWTVDNTDRLEGNSRLITDDTNFRAEWFFPVARIERTQKLYPSIMAAEAEAQNGDIITLLVDTEEVVTNEKTITLDLNYHTVTGYLLNTADGDITLVNGEINNYNSPIHNTENPAGAAVVNYGKITMGIDDYTGGDTNQKAPLISADNIRLIGTDVGLLQAGHFDFFDGYIEGVIGLDGSYDHSPWYRDTFDGVIVYYFPFVDRNTEKDCQHVSLENSDKAVSKTINGGEIYYYNLQDNVNTSARTGYDIYAVRNFDASYPITVANNTNIVFDLYGWTVNFGEETQIEGNLTLRDSKTGDEAGLLTLSKTLYNNGTLTISNATAKGIAVNNFMQNNGNLVMRNATISSDKSITVVVRNNGSTYDLDENSYITSSSSSTPTMVNYANDLNITSGHITSNGYIAIKNMRDSAITVSGGEVSNNNANGNCAINGDSDNMTLTMTGGKVSSTNDKSQTANAVCYMHIKMSGGEISANSNYNSHAIVGSSRTINITNGTVSATAQNNAAVAISGDRMTTTISGNNTIIQATSTASSAICVEGDYGSTTVNSGKLIAESTNGTARAINDMEKTITINGGELSAHSINGDALGIGTTGRWSPYINIHGGKITAIADNPDRAGTGVSGYNLSMDGGEVYGNTYGIRDIYTTDVTITGGKVEGGNFGLYGITATLGTNDIVDGHSVINTASPEIIGGINAISGGYINFYDGILKGGDAHINSEDIIKAVPDGAHRHVETVDDKEHCWLEADDDYLEVDGETFNSLTGAYAKVQDGGTINVIANATTAAVLPTNTKNITFNLGEFTVSYMQPLKNNGTIKFTGTGTLKNTNTNYPTVENYGTVEVASGHIVGIGSPAIKNMRDSAMIMSGGEVSLTEANGKCAVHGDSNNMTLTMTGGKISAISSGNQAANAVCYMHLQMSGGEISASSNGDAVAISGGSRTINISGGTISATTVNNTARAISGDYMNTTISGTDTLVLAKATGNGHAIGVDGDYGSTTVNSGKLAAEADGTGNAKAINDMEKNIYLNDGEIYAHSVGGDALGIGTTGRWAPYIHIHGGKVTAIADSTNRTGTGSAGYNFEMDGGEVYGSTYGIRELYTSGTITGGKVEGGVNGIENTTMTIGVNDIIDNHAHVVINTPEIKGGQYAINNGRINFYDGILKGGNLHVNDVTIFKAIPDGTHRHTERVGEEEHCWLVEDDDYLEVDGETFNSLTGAYAKVQDGGTINVIANASTPAVLPNNDKTITFNLNEFTLNYKQPLKNSGNITFTGTGYIIGSNASNPTIENSGTITVASGHIINESTTAINNIGTTSLTVTGGEISISEYTGGCAVYGNSNNAILTMTGGKISATSSQTRSTTAVCGMRVEMSGGEISASSNSDAIAISGGSRTINISGGTISATTVNNTARGISGDYMNTTISGANTIVRAEATGNGNAILTNGDYGSMTVNNGKLIAETNGTGRAVVVDDMEKTITINAGELIAHSVNGETLGIGTTGRWSTYVNIKGGKVSAISDNPDRIGTGSTGYNFKMTGGEVYGSTYGVRDIYSGDATIGENDDAVNNGLDDTTDKPLIRGGTYGIYNSSFKFYDGVIEGGVAPHFDRNIKAIADNTNILYSQETIDGKSYETARLVAEEDVARIGTGADAEFYKSLDAAIEHAETDDTIYLIRDAYTYSTLNIPSGKKFTLDLNGNNIIAANHIDNSGDVIITNSNSTNPVVEYHDSDIFIQNQSGASLEINGLKIKANRIAANNGGTLGFVGAELTNYTSANEYLLRNSGGTLNLNDTAINSTLSNNVIYSDTGSLNIVDSDIRASYGIYIYNLSADSAISNSVIETLAEYNANSVYVYSGAAKLTINDHTEILGNLYFNASQLYVKDTKFEETSVRNETNIYVDRNATAEFDNITVKHTQADAYNGGGEKSDIRNVGTTVIKNSDIEQLFTPNNHSIYNQARVITNTGTLEINNTTIKQNDYANSEYSSLAIYNNGTLTMTDTTVTTARSRTTAYGLYNDGTGVTNIDTSSITVTGKKAYGLYINSGELTLGEPEPEFLPDGTRNPKYGRSDANVSTSTPFISAIGETPGVAVTMNGGTFNFYDGKLVQNNPNGPALQPDGSNIAISNVEYIYQPEAYEDIYGNYYFILEFMRNP